MGVFQTPGLHTDIQDSWPLADLAARGFRWITYQVQNDTLTKERDLRPAKQAGLSPGVWGCSYSQANLARDARVLRQIAEAAGAEHLLFNVEFGHDPTPYLVELADFRGEKALVTLTGETPNINAAKIAAAGWTIMPEDYLNDQTTTTPAVSEWYLAREGVPKDQINHTLGMYVGALGRISGAEYVQKLKEAGVGNNFSLWMLEQADQEQMDALSAHITVPDPVVELMEKLKLSNTGINAVLDRLERVFDANGIEEPDGIDALRKHLSAVGLKINEVIDELNAR